MWMLLLACGPDLTGRWTTDGIAPDGWIEAANTAAAVELAEQSLDAGEITELQRKIEQDENDHQSRFDLALALQGAGKPEAAADELLEIVRRNRSWNDEAARKQLIKLFDAWGQTDPLTQEVRSRLSSILFS